MRRAAAGLFLLASAVGGPYLVFESSAGRQLQSFFSAPTGAGSPQAPGTGAWTGGALSGGEWAMPEYPPYPNPQYSGPTWSGAGSLPPTAQAAPGSAAGPWDNSPSRSAATAERGWLTGTASDNRANGTAASAQADPLRLPGLDPKDYLVKVPQLPAINGQDYRYQSIQALQEVLRFDISPTWVIQRFPQVATVTADTRLDGLRVPLVTGTTPTDLAGTLTYYFDHYKRVQRITVHAITGDPSRFLAELQHAYQLQQQPSLGGGLYVKKWNGRPASLVYTALAPVISADNPYSRYQFYAEINQAGLEYGLSSDAQQLLDAGRANNRWQ
jgi:hypothetical protein